MKSTCSVDICDRPVLRKTYCDRHYQRSLENGGDPLAHIPIRAQGADRLIRTCTKCQRDLPATAFGMRSNGRWRRSACKECESHSFARYREENRESTDEAYWRSKLFRKYGITPAEYDEMLRRQSGGCAICGTTKAGGPGNRNRFCVDHCHDTGEVRGLLCNGCNRGIAYLGDDAAGLRRALAYMETAEEAIRTRTERQR